jgi:Ca2+:H+ antiporter
MGLNLLLVFIPVALVLDWFEANPILVFLASAVSIVPLAGLMGRATENLAVYVGATIGGLLTASLGNAPELIIALSALSKGLTDVVKASITGAILANLLLALGLAMLLGGFRYERQRFNTTSAGMSAGLLLLAAIGLVVPALHNFTVEKAEELSFEIAVVLFSVYILSLVFTLVTHRQLFREVETNPEHTLKSSKENPEKAKEEGEAAWGKNKALGILALVTIAIAVMSEALTGAIEPAAESLGLTPIFAGVILLAGTGAAAELLNAVRFARKGNMDLAFGIVTGSSTQIALFVAPVLVFTSYFMGEPLDLLFSAFEVAAIMLTVLIVARLTTDGECHWMEGVMLLGVYLILGIGFFYIPAS